VSMAGISGVFTRRSGGAVYTKLLERKGRSGNAEAPHVLVSSA
jgi:hypothetical protein